MLSIMQKAPEDWPLLTAQETLLQRYSLSSLCTVRTLLKAPSLTHVQSNKIHPCVVQREVNASGLACIYLYIWTRCLLHPKSRAGVEGPAGQKVQAEHTELSEAVPGSPLCQSTEVKSVET